MASIELYINQQLCETEDPENFSVYLKRQLLNPAELSTKDAQRSYDITLPATDRNNGIFGYLNTEEVKGKFSQLYDARLLVNGVEVFDGKFKMSEITKDWYKGNLGIPAQKTIKDIFGEMKMNEAGEWLIDFEKIDDISAYNTGEKGETPPCFFPLVMYGLLPKTPINNRYSPKNVLDSTVTFRQDDFPPSINCLQALQQIFSEQGYKLSGSAFSDERLTNLYMSYKNPVEYQMPWNYGKIGNIDIAVSWDNAKRPGNMANPITPEKEYVRGEHDRAIYAVDLLNTDNGVYDHNSEENITIQGKRRIITIPYSCYYKIDFNATITLDQQGISQIYSDDPKIISPTSKAAGKYNYETLKNRRFEIKVISYEDEVELEDVKYDNVFYKNNQYQDKDTDGNSTNKIFPQSGCVNFIDQAQNENILCGFSFGDNYGDYNPADEKRLYCNPIALKGGASWSSEYNNKIKHVATYSPGYMKAYTENGVEKYKESDIYKIDMENVYHPETNIGGMDNSVGQGYISQIVWLEKGDKITIVTNSDEGVQYEWDMFVQNKTIYGWLRHHISASLNISAFQEDPDWLKMDEHNNSTETIDWKERKSVLFNNINLIRFLPSESKVDEWIDNFCKAFNLDLIQTGFTNFELNTKRNRELSTSTIIDLDEKTNINLDRRNNSLQLPSTYEIGFTIDKNEQGYIETNESGGGIYQTGSPEDKKLNQTSNFSYNWYKQLYNSDIEPIIKIPLISEKEVWRDITTDYDSMVSKRYYNKAQRFWYKNGNEYYPILINKNTLKAGITKDVFIKNNQSIRLDYKTRDALNNDTANSILDNYFVIMANVENNYTIVETFLTSDEYNSLSSCYVKLNGDLYYVAEIDGYDPLGKKKTTLKLIRKTF
ncbi:MAG: hypothetical protein E6767_02275 [Dysgonomonas sp.]|nr:hypothetical protein [Dysgonomonas sp.]